MNKILFNHVEITKRMNVSSFCGFDIINSLFQNISSDAFQGGGLYIENANTISIVCTLFKRCSSTNFGGAFYIFGKKCIVSKCYCVDCFHTVVLSWNIGGGGYIKSSEEIKHESSTVFHCAPPDKLPIGAHGSFGIEGGVITAKDVNVSRGSRCGYVIWNFNDIPNSKFLNIDNMGNSLLYLNNGPTAKFSMINLINQNVADHAAFFCIITSTNLDNIIFIGNILDLKTDRGSINIKNSLTDKSFLWSNAVNCSTGVESPETYNLYYSPSCDDITMDHIWSQKERNSFMNHKMVLILGLLFK